MNLYNKERPRSFSGIVGQEKTVRIISKDIVQGTPKHAYLFSGVRGTGKTTMARILAHSFNCEHPLADGSPCCECDSCKEITQGASLDVYELDAASNNSVENIREILEKVQYKPIHRKKVFILDECHMLSTAASNALLKVLEEPPADVVFILCTTEAHKMLPTIISRCSRYDFEKIPLAEISEYLGQICAKNAAAYEKAALDMIAKAAGGSLRDALSILDKFISEGNIRASVVSDVLGMAPEQAVFDILNAIAEGDAASAVMAVKAVSGRGGNMGLLVQEIINTLLDTVDFQSTGNTDSIIGDGDYRENVVNLAYKVHTAKAFDIMEEFRLAYQQKADEFFMTTAILAAINKKCLLEEMQKEIETLKARVETLGQNVHTPVPAVPQEQVQEPEQEPENMPDSADVSVPENIPDAPEAGGTPVPAENPQTQSFQFEDDYEDDGIQINPASSGIPAEPGTAPVAGRFTASDGTPDSGKAAEAVAAPAGPAGISSGMSFDELAESIHSSENIPKTKEQEETAPDDEEMTGALARLWDFM